MVEYTVAEVDIRILTLILIITRKVIQSTTAVAIHTRRIITTNIITIIRSRTRSPTIQDRITVGVVTITESITEDFIELINRFFLQNV